MAATTTSPSSQGAARLYGKSHICRASNLHVKGEIVALLGA